MSNEGTVFKIIAPEIMRYKWVSFDMRGRIQSFVNCQLNDKSEFRKLWVFRNNNCSVTKLKPFLLYVGIWIDEFLFSIKYKTVFIPSQGILSSPVLRSCFSSWDKFVSMFSVGR